MSKRKKFLITSSILSLGFIAIQMFDSTIKIWEIIALSIASAALFAWSLSEGLSKNATLLTLLLPPMFTFGVGLFWFLIPTSVLVRFPVVIVYGLGLYALCLTANIFTVGAIRTIALIRAARGVGFVLTLITFFLLFDAISSIRISVWATVALSLLSSFPLFLQGLWSSTLDSFVSKQIWIYTGMFSLVVGEMAAVIYLWPVSVSVNSLFLTLACYICLGLGQAQIEQRLFKQVIREYIVIGIFVFVTMVLSTRWGG